jgi:hypothetical protein
MKCVCLVTVVALAGALVEPSAVSAQQAQVEREALPRILRPTTPPPSGPVNPDARILPGTRFEVFTTTIQGNALTSTNGMLTDGTVRLRDARFGRIVDVTTTDKAGVFVFHQVSPGTYVVELVGPDGSVLAASQILNVNAGEAISAIVKLPFRLPVGGLLGNHAPTAAIITATAAASGILATRVAGTAVSPRQ